MQSPCRRCEHRKSVIILRSQYRSGLGDAQLVLARVGHLAGALCARLLPQAPCEQLWGALNLGRPVSCKVDWFRYFHPVFVQDNSSLLVGSSAGWTRSHNVETISSKNGDVLKQADAAVAADAAGRRFMWVLNESYYSWADQLDQHLRSRAGSGMPPPFIRRKFVWKNGVGTLRPLEGPSCSYVRVDPSATVQMLAAKLIGSTNISRIPFIALHVRRGIADGNTRLCTTDVVNIVDYARCMLGRATTLPPHQVIKDRSIPLILFSDEANQEWRQAVLKRLGHVSDYAIHTLDGDARLRTLARNLVGDDDDFVVFAAANLVRSWASVSLEVRRCFTLAGTSGHHAHCLRVSGMQGR